MIGTLFLIIIYMAFISLGLPDSLLGVAWPLMQNDYKTSFEFAGLVSIFISAGTIISSLTSGLVHRYISTGQVTLISCLLTASALLGFSYSPSLLWLVLLAIPLGLGAGAVDAALNNYVASHYQAHHMNWLHCFWGVGATLGPIIMSWFIANQNSWRGGYLAISLIQFTLALILFFSLPLWKRMATKTHNTDQSIDSKKDDTFNDQDNQVKPLNIPGVKFALASFLFYCGAETTMGLWGSSYLVNIKGLSVTTAAHWVSFYYGGITVGRIISGFISMKIDNNLLIRFGQITALFGSIMLVLPLANYFSLIGFIMVGLGLAPIFPSMIHQTPARFGKKYSQDIIGYQMASAYTGITLLPPLLGFIASRSTIAIHPFFVMACIIVMFICSEKIKRITVHS